jgi:hypothetical protein
MVAECKACYMRFVLDLQTASSSLGDIALRHCPFLFEIEKLFDHCSRMRHSSFRIFFFRLKLSYRKLLVWLVLWLRRLLGHPLGCQQVTVDL